MSLFNALMPYDFIELSFTISSPSNTKTTITGTRLYY